MVVVSDEIAGERRRLARVGCALAIAIFLAPGCRSLTEKTYVTKDVDPQERATQDQAAGAANLVGEIVAWVVNGRTRHQGW